MLDTLATTLVSLIFDMGYLGIFLLMLIESSFIPFPSELVLIPAGFLASKGEMSLILIFIASLLGSMVGSFINYYLAFFVGRAFLIKYGNYFFISNKTLLKMEDFFENHGSISTFSGRLIPGIRQLISIPAGLSKMNIYKFSLYTSLGATSWSIVLIALGYVLGENQDMISNYLKQITFVTIALLSVLIVVYIVKKRKKSL